MSDKATERVKALTKKKGNLNCFDCGTLATGSPQAVLSPFGVFVCVTCGGLHRELQHRTKGVSMSTFKDEEADFMETHGNKRMKSTYYAYFDASKHAPLDKMAGDANKLRPFLKMVYEEKLFHIDNPSNSGKNRVIYPEAGEATQQKSSLSSSSSSSFNFPSTSSSSQSQSSSSFSSAPATGTTGRLSAAPPTASTSRVVRGSRATSNASGGATSLDNFDTYYNVGSGAAVVSSTKTLSTTSSTSNDPFSFGATSTTPPGQQSSAAAIAAAKPKQQTVSDILGGLGDLYAAAPLSQKESPQFQQQQQQQNVSQTHNSPFDFGGQQQQQQQPQQQQWGVQSTSTFPQAQAQSSWGMQPQQVISSSQPQNLFNSQNAYGSTQHQQQQQANVGAFQQGSFATQTQKPSTQPQQNLDPFSSFGDMSSTINHVVPIETFTTRDFGHQASQPLQQSVTSHASHDPFGGFGGQATMSTVSNAPSLSRPSTTVQASNDPFGNSFGSSSQFGSTSSTTTTTTASFGGGHFSTSTSNVQMNAPNPFSSPPPQTKPSGPVNPFDLF